MRTDEGVKWLYFYLPFAPFLFSLFLSLSLSIYIYIYIYVCVDGTKISKKVRYTTISQMVLGAKHTRAPRKVHVP